MDIIRHIRGIFVIFLHALILAGCISEDMSNCFTAYSERYVVLKAVDAETGTDITGAGGTGDAELYLFTLDGRFAWHFSVTEDMITSQVPVPLPEGEWGGCYVSVWTNAGSGQTFHTPAENTMLDGRAVSLITGDGGYGLSPDDLFFGSMRLAEKAGYEPEIITVSRKNARMSVTVRGLDVSLQDSGYYITVKIPNDGYSFTGSPTAGETMFRKTGQFSQNGDFSTSEAFTLIHTEPDADNRVTVCVYGKGSGQGGNSGRLIVSVTEDENGEPIDLPAGQTLNLLIDIAGSGVGIYTEITSWNEIFQWSSW